MKTVPLGVSLITSLENYISPLHVYHVAPSSLQPEMASPLSHKNYLHEGEKWCGTLGKPNPSLLPS